jgi:hypothetical protein
MRYALLTALLLLIAGSIAYAQDQLVGLASPYWTRTQTFAGNACFTDEAGDCALFPAANSVHHRRRVVVVKSSAAGVCCWVGDPATTIDATGAVIAIGANIQVATSASSNSQATHTFLTAYTPAGAAIDLSLASHEIDFIVIGRLA